MGDAGARLEVGGAAKGARQVDITRAIHRHAGGVHGYGAEGSGPDQAAARIELGGELIGAATAVRLTVPGPGSTSTTPEK